MDDLQAKIYKGYFHATHIQNIFVNPHAILRYKQRTGSSKSDKVVEGKLLKALQKSYEVEIKDRFRINALLNNNLVEARYFRHGDWILVVRGTELITIHEGTAGRWSRDPKENQPKFHFELESKKDIQTEEKTKEVKEELFSNPANSHGEWGNFSLFSCVVDGNPEEILIVKIKKAKRRGLKYFSKENPFLYIRLSEVKGLDPKGCKPNWKTGKIGYIENGTIFVNSVNESQSVPELCNQENC